MYGEKIKMYYDPRGQVIKTENPDGSEQRVVYGIPDSLTTPNYYAPTAWETYTYDANDLTVTSADYGTPKSAEVDALGRTIKTLDRLESSNSVTNNVRMQYSYDVRGNLLQVTDAYERTVFRHVYDLRPPAKEGEGIPPLKTVHINKGTSTVVFDCTGKPVETRDAKGALTLHTYDVLQRPTSVWCRDIDTEEVTLRNYLEYGTDNSNNNKGKPTKNYNESGLLRTENYDFKGNLLAKFQQAIANEKIQHVIDESSTSGWTDIKCYRVDWKGLPGDLLGGPEYRTDMEYDALNRLMQLTYPEDASSTRKVLVPTYNKAGALQQVVVDGTPYVNQIGYNAKGQRLIIAYGNGLMTRYTYNALTFRLTRMRTESYTTSQSGNQHTYAYTSGTCKQDMAYTYDKVGNILSITNAAPQSGVGGSSTLEREFDYDALYRLLSATGRENQPTGLYWDDSYRSDDVNTTTAYTQNYDYDLMGNLNELQHTGDTNFTRTYNHTDNLLESFEVGSNTYYYQYDVCGNQIQENEERHMQWDYADKLRLYYNQTSSGTEPSVYTHYLYDAGGNRVKKYTRTAGGNWETITYIDGLIEYREDQDGKIQNINHVMDDTKRIATIRDGYDFGDTTPKIKYNFDDHLGSSNILVDDSGTLVNQEEYYPFGETSFGAYAKKRYHFCGKEKDEESGMYYYGARYYSHWLCRFISVDPLAGKYPFYTPYQYAGNKPINKLDRDGLEETGSSPQQPADSSNTGGENSITPDSTTTTDSKDTVAVPPPTDSKSTPDTTQNAKTKPAPTQRKENTIPLHKVTGVKIDMSFDRGKGAGMQSTDYLNTEVIKNKIHLATDAKPTSNSNIEPIGNVIDSKYFKGQAPKIV
jgi:RHS repeat-associated protein